MRTTIYIKLLDNGFIDKASGTYSNMSSTELDVPHGDDTALDVYMFKLHTSKQTRNKVIELIPTTSITKTMESYNANVVEHKRIYNINRFLEEMPSDRTIAELTFQELLNTGWKMSKRLIREIMTNIAREASIVSQITHPQYDIGILPYRLTKTDLETFYKVSNFKTFDKFVRDMVQPNESSCWNGVFDLFEYALGEELPFVQYIKYENHRTSIDVCNLSYYERNVETIKETFFRSMNSGTGFRVSPLNHCEEIKTYIQLGRINL